MHTNRNLSTTVPNMERKKDNKIGVYQLVKSIGCGTFATVKLAMHSLINQKVAVKIIDKEVLKKEGHDRLKTEILTLQKVQSHPCIITLHQVMESRNHVYIITEYATNGDLYDYISSKGAMSENIAADIYLQIVSALIHCHRLGITHRDLKAENILFDENMTPKLADFGFARTYKAEANTNNVLLKTWCGSPPYAAPELFRGNAYQPEYVDVWSSAIVLYYMVSGCLPFYADDLPKLKDKVCSGVYNMPKRLSNNLKELISSLLKVDPNERLSLKQIASHDWFRMNCSPMFFSYLKSNGNMGMLLNDQAARVFTGGVLRNGECERLLAEEAFEKTIEGIITKSNYEKNSSLLEGVKYKVLKSINSNLFDDYYAIYSIILNQKYRFIRNHIIRSLKQMKLCSNISSFSASHRQQQIQHLQQQQQQQQQQQSSQINPSSMKKSGNIDPIHLQCNHHERNQFQQNHKFKKEMTNDKFIPNQSFNECNNDNQLKNGHNERKFLKFNLPHLIDEQRNRLEALQIHQQQQQQQQQKQVNQLENCHNELSSTTMNDPDEFLNYIYKNIPIINFKDPNHSGNDVSNYQSNNRLSISEQMPLIPAHQLPQFQNNQNVQQPSQFDQFKETDHSLEGGTIQPNHIPKIDESIKEEFLPVIDEKQTANIKNFIDNILHSPIQQNQTTINPNWNICPNHKLDNRIETTKSNRQFNTNVNGITNSSQFPSNLENGKNDKDDIPTISISNELKGRLGHPALKYLAQLNDFQMGNIKPETSMRRGSLFTPLSSLHPNVERMKRIPTMNTFRLFKPDLLTIDQKFDDLSYTNMSNANRKRSSIRISPNVNNKECEKSSSFFPKTIQYTTDYLLKEGENKKNLNDIGHNDEKDEQILSMLNSNNTTHNHKLPTILKNLIETTNFSTLNNPHIIYSTNSNNNKHNNNNNNNNINNNNNNINNNNNNNNNNINNYNYNIPYDVDESEAPLKRRKDVHRLSNEMNDLGKRPVIVGSSDCRLDETCFNSSI
ncbi:hypothetical protein SNEBB_001647 [Seison nebaliae]|nr:hypothetical protein SNEBB_001647 [Seison nebaliae]